MPRSLSGRKTTRTVYVIHIYYVLSKQFVSVLKRLADNIAEYAIGMRCGIVGDRAQPAQIHVALCVQYRLVGLHIDDLAHDVHFT